MCDRHRYKWEEVVRRRRRDYEMHCVTCGKVIPVSVTPAGGEPWRHTFSNNMQWAARVERAMQKRGAA